MLAVIPFPAIDPVAVRLGPIAVRWYALAYVVGLICAWWLVRRVGSGSAAILGKRDADDLLMWATLGVVFGGRLGYVLFYKPGYYISHLDEVLSLWRGGMSFHGGMLGVVLAAVLFARARRLNIFSVGDLAALAAPIGLFFGRIANFINGELWGRASSVSWAMIFPDPRAGNIPRHPSQLYEAALEGIVLFAALLLAMRFLGSLKRPGEIGGLFLVGYGIARIVSEFFREPDAHLGFLFAGATMGQLLSLPMIAVGLWLILRARRKPAAPATKAPGGA
ncbi:MAG: prolipoprotein diacylglyceryl transferase [Alphaproteobacteria bacterium]|nr:prolipoprotein diacylglyceryl transferase [Alphaproteobacteria bacterium]